MGCYVTEITLDTRTNLRVNENNGFRDSSCISAGFIKGRFNSEMSNFHGKIRRSSGHIVWYINTILYITKIEKYLRVLSRYKFYLLILFFNLNFHETRVNFSHVESKRDFAREEKASYYWKWTRAQGTLSNLHDFKGLQMKGRWCIGGNRKP